MINAHLLKKYDTQFHFFFSKPISQIVYNHTYAEPTLQFKDIIIYSESSQYLKRVYHIKNAAGRNEIFDRINMLADFYCGAAMLKYEHPMMVISKTKDIFLKRIKRMKKMIASDCSSQQTSEQKSENSSQFQQFSSSRFLRTINTNQLSSSQKQQDSLIKNCRKTERSFDSQLHDIFCDDMLDLNSFNQKLNSTDKHKITKNPYLEGQNFGKKHLLQSALQHLIIDVDDIDKQKAIKQYRKAQLGQTNSQGQQTQFQPQHNMNKNKTKKDGGMKKSNIIITALDNYTPGDKESQSSGAYNYYPKNSKNQKKQQQNNRYREEYDQTIRLNNYNSNNVGNSNNYYSYKNSQNYPQGHGYSSKYQRAFAPATRSPSFGAPNYYMEGNSTERNKNINSPTRAYPNFKQDQPTYESKRVSQDRNLGQSTKYTINSPNYGHEYKRFQGRQRQRQSQRLSQMLDSNPIQHQTYYLTQQNSVSNLANSSSNRAKKQFIRQKAVALLNKVKSQQKLPLHGYTSISSNNSNSNCYVTSCEYYEQPQLHHKLLKNGSKLRFQSFQ